MSIDLIITEAVSRAVEDLFGVAAGTPVQLEQTPKDFEGNLTVVVFPFLRAARLRPEECATRIGQWLVEHEPAVERFNVVKGFLNIVIRPTFWNSVLAHMEETPNWGLTAAAADSPLVMVEYSSPNTNKPLHLGHVRNILLGNSLSRILAACGNRVVKTNIVNDRGIHICKSMLAWRKWGNGATPESTGKKGDHLIGDFYVRFASELSAEKKALIAKAEAEGHPMTDEEAEAASTLMQEARAMLRAWEDGDPEVRALWEMMNQWVYDGFDVTYGRLGVDFDKIYYESQTYLDGKAVVLDGLERGLLYRREDGSVWADLTPQGLDHKLLLRSDGTSVYMTQDIGTARQRYNDYAIDKMIYVVGNEQNYHFQVLSILLDRLGFKWGKDLVHFSYGMVELPNGKMKSREGTVVDADDLIDKMVGDAAAMSKEMGKLQDVSEDEAAEVSRKIGLGALKYFLLKVDPRKNMTFNPEESIDFNGNTGPFIQYTYARIQSVLRRAEADGLTGGDYSEAVPGEREITLIQRLADFPGVVSDAGQTYSPAKIANYAYELTKEYNQFYHDCSILREERPDVRALRLTLSDMTAKVLATALGLLGIEMPERM